MLSKSRARAHVRAALRSAVARERKYSWREYQMEGAWSVFRALKQKKSVTLNLPTGTGKTLLANFLTLLWAANEPGQVALYIVPRRILVTQHCEMARWLAPAHEVVALTDELVGRRAQLHARTKRASILISTPELFANLARSHRLSPELVARIAFVVVDEFDEFLSFEYDHSGPCARFDLAFDALRSVLPRRMPTLLLSGTSPVDAVARGSRDLVVSTLAALVMRKYRPVPLRLRERSYARYLPVAHVLVTAVKDAAVVNLDQAVRTEKRLCMDQLCLKFEGAIDEVFVLTRLEAILDGRVTTIPVLSGPQRGKVRLDGKTMRLLGALRRYLGYYDFLYEDMFAGFAVDVKETWFLNRETMALFVRAASRLDDRRGAADCASQMMPEIHGKGTRLCQLVDRIRGRGVVFVRHIRIADELATKMRERHHEVIQIDGRLDDSGRESALADFKKKKRCTLVITRETGKRGLDLPQADYAVFYSPKAREHTVWQELSRIRSNVARTKNSYMLFYDETGEATKMGRLIVQMKASGRMYRLRLPSPEWLGKIAPPDDFV